MLTLATVSGIVSTYIASRRVLEKNQSRLAALQRIIASRILVVGDITHYRCRIPQILKSVHMKKRVRIMDFLLIYLI